VSELKQRRKRMIEMQRELDHDNKLFLTVSKTNERLKNMIAKHEAV
jgi:hypothetical protein